MTTSLTGVTYTPTCTACPVQLDGHADGVPFYYRYRFGWLTVGFGGEPVDAPEWEYSARIGGPWDGSMTDDEVEEWLAAAVEARRAHVAAQGGRL